MDERLLAWARAVKQRRRSGWPVLWLFTDARRLPDPLSAIAGLPQGLCGVVFRHDGVSERAALARRVARLCARRRLALVVAGDARLASAIGAGIHLRGGKWPGRVRRGSLVTSSAHNVAEIRQARHAGAQIIFLSPAFTTESHPNSPALGSIKWVNIARQFKDLEVYCLGGVSGRNLLFLGHHAAGAGAITGLIP